MLGSSQLGGRIALPGPQQEQRMRVQLPSYFSYPDLHFRAPPFHPLPPLVVPLEPLVQVLEMQT
jgi:hypothetical protein